MKFLRCSLLVAAAVAVSSLSSVHAQHAGSPLISEAGTPGEELVTPQYHLRRDLAGSSDGPTPTTTSPTPTTAPTPPPPVPTTQTPAPTTTSPATTAPAPTTTAPATTAPATTAPATTAPATTAPVATTTAPPTTDGNTTPAPTTTKPATTKPATSGSIGTDITETPVATRSETPVSSRDGSEDGAATKPAAGSSDSNVSASKSSKMSTGTIIGIVCGIVGGVAILAIIAVVLARRRRNEDDDPLSPFELSMDKGYNGVAVMQNNHQGSEYGNNHNNGYSGARTTTNNSAMLGGAAVGAGVGMGVGAAMLSTNTPQAGSDAAGVTYTQFYDVVTSPGSAYTQQRLSHHTDDNAAVNNDSNLWMSAMEPKDNDVEGASVPPEVSLPGDEYDDDNNSSFISRNSYDQIAGSESIDIDQSSVLSGGSDLEKDFPDYEDDSSRGSYEL